MRSRFVAIMTGPYPLSWKLNPVFKTRHSGELPRHLPLQAEATEPGHTHVLPVALSHSPSPSRSPVCLQLYSWQLSDEQVIGIQLVYEADAVPIGIQQLIDVTVVIGNCSPGLDRASQASTAG